MNVLLLAHRVPYPPNKGEKIRTFHQLSHLLNKGHNVVVAAPLENKPERQFALQLQNKLDVRVVHALLPKRWLRFASGLIKNKPISVTYFYSKKLQQQVNELIETGNHDTLLCTSSALADYILNKTTLQKIQQKKIRLVMDFMDLDCLKWQQYSEKSPWLLSAIYKREAKLLSRTEQQILATFDASIFVSEDEKSLLTTDSKLRDKIHVVTNGVDTSVYHPGQNTAERPSTTSPTFLFTGVMNYLPNENAVIWFAKTVWPLAVEKYPQAQFIIAGMQPSKSVTKLGQQKGIVVTGFVEDILPYYQESDLMVAPFKVARGIQNKVIQALASGLPVITSTEGAAGISCTVGKHLLVANSAAEIVQAIETLLNDKEQYRNLQQAGLALIEEKYSWAVENDKLESILKQK